MYARAVRQVTVTAAFVLVVLVAVWPAVVGDVPYGQAAANQVSLWVQTVPTWLAVAAVATAVVCVVSAVVENAPTRRDDRRAFTVQDRATSFALAHWRCEHRPLVGFRCTVQATHADHVVPWSKGGPTVLSNCQALCQRHNLVKSNHMPTLFYVWRLQRRRRRYYPATQPVEVAWRA